MHIACSTSTTDAPKCEERTLSNNVQYSVYRQDNGQRHVFYAFICVCYLLRFHITITMRPKILLLCAVCYQKTEVQLKAFNPTRTTNTTNVLRANGNVKLANEYGVSLTFITLSYLPSAFQLRSMNLQKTSRIRHKKSAEKLFSL